MEIGYDGEYYFVELSKEEVLELKEIVSRKVRERSNSKNM
jgi:hypothetical protein